MTHHIVALCGSMRLGSHTKMALEVASQAARDSGAEVTTVDLAQWPLPLFDDGPSREDPMVLRFKAQIAEADGLIIATPVYHESLSGALKNAIDHLYEELRGKVAGLIAVCGGRVGSALALEHMRTILRETQTWIIPRHVPVGFSKDAFDENERPVDPGTEQRLEALGKEVYLRSRIFRPRRAAVASQS